MPGPKQPAAESAPEVARVVEAVDRSIETRLIPIASGKGGVGKTNISVNLSIALADLVVAAAHPGKVILVDCDFGLPNADILLNASIDRSIDDFIGKKLENLSDALTPTGIDRLHFLSGSATPSMTLSNLQYQQRQKFLRHIRSLNAEYVILDLGASVHYEVVDFFAMVNTGIVVTNPEPTAMRDSYLFLRAVVYRKIQKEAKEWPIIAEYMDLLENGQLPIPTIPGVLDQLRNDQRTLEHKALKSILEAFRPKLIMNRSETFEEGLEAARKMNSEARRELGIEISYLGPIIDDPCVVKAVKESTPFLRRFPSCEASEWMRKLANRIVEQDDFSLEKNYFSFGNYIKRIFSGNGKDR